ncbi:tRNA (adenosine(37)-N6)-threonylcarbamoyltransferase complex dimerization subunit type 1 TsaB [Pediococcus claussenii]|uniref:Glycoprotease family protein n=1 Tax=Pediococcus claussenii (strain ATCC BAA-344 / DSM 14800 / JCM 18046 / KCTC 3811 / LMG 21948 / P06) TaxID=701521 RepID=G8PBY9_PEDCP|nr:tRNA (adenosine(37)-N6)-threonylcarbamoyltransferase complex dimerization subunit type 1 TsaB [Pediococcus claussenii]AEV94808.1 glycoprotease family protein [Pediococcus claussenii ATCC BAA-344]ANZ70005.1 tRNA threonylcarbamoyladenosine biosynthesis protein TsaB [Pediococcus claussenii]ANZ71820.1 tRNA threonylcarbamoyladenosine biosynthesis protein TsaB [Pediococcus claussenii]KRN20987.1 hypothetical protein IV79_GL000212 [Pediococcus claussenii]
MKILAFDTSNQALSVALLEDQNLLSMQTTNIKRNHSVQLMPVIDHVLKSASVDIQSIGRIVVAEGPGSYTGLRIAVTTAKTLAETIDAELVGISSLEMLVLNAPVDGIVVPFFDARQKNVFAGVYEKSGEKLKTIQADQHIAMKDLLHFLNGLGKSVYFISTDFDKFQLEIEDTLKVIAEHSNRLNNLPNAFALGLLGFQKQELENVFSFIPNYLRKTEAERTWETSHPQELKKESYVKRMD